MFSLSFWEVFFCVVVALIVLKPEDVPVIAKQIGKWVRTVKSYFSEFTGILDDNDKPRTKSLIADDGLEYEAYSVDDVMKDLNNARKKKKSTKPKPKTQKTSKPASKVSGNKPKKSVKKSNATKKQK